jgi:hypothetical protein
MRIHPWPGRIDQVQAPAPMQLTVELELDGDLMRGIVRDRFDRTVRFTGWLGLIGALDELQRPPEGGPEQPDRSRG